MIGENIKKLRVANDMTQKDLADKLFVTPQAVSRWEKDIVEPNLSTIAELSKIFNVSTNVILGIDEQEENQLHDGKVDVFDSMNPVLAVCEMCNKPIYDAEDICRVTYGGVQHIRCKQCDENVKKRNEEAAIKHSKKKRLLSYIVGAIVAVAMLVFGIIGAGANPDAYDIILMILLPVTTFTFTGCQCLNNNWVANMMSWAFTNGFIRMPGVIFNLSLDGIIWLITVKLFLWILNLLISVILVVAVFILSLICSLFEYPFALYNSFRHPEDVD